MDILEAQELEELAVTPEMEDRYGAIDDALIPETIEESKEILRKHGVNVEEWEDRMWKMVQEQLEIISNEGEE